MPDNPILVEVTRANEIESVHRGAACVVDAEGGIVAGVGDIAQGVCPRSAIKFLQALPLVESGAADAFRVSDEELALACASHSGEPMHVTRVAAWLTRLGLTAGHLECGSHAPSSQKAAEALVCGGGAYTALHNNCSGKHTGFLTLALHLGAPVMGYTLPAHPVQKAVLGAVGEICSVSTAATVRDGCSAPNVFMPLRALALGFARLGSGAGLTAARAAAARRIRAAVKAHPVLMSGHGRPCATLIDALKDGGIVKTGAEGVFAAALPERGLGIAVKIDDGASRAAVVAIAGLLEALGAFRAQAAAAVHGLTHPGIAAWTGAATGEIRAASGYLMSLERSLNSGVPA